MKTTNLFAPFVMFCVVAALVGCATRNRQVSEASFDEQPVQPAPSSKGLSQPVFPDESAFQELDLDTNRPVTFEEWRHFDKSSGAKEHFNAFDVNGDEQINATEVLSQAPKQLKFYRFFGGVDPTDESFSLSESEEFQQQGW